ncbi:MAG: hypothetical protein LBS43_00730 [Prevotellaceae bacterium]|nr:hypothetical protein [Prevotellaceae bacterium]
MYSCRMYFCPVLSGLAFPVKWSDVSAAKRSGSRLRTAKLKRQSVSRQNL